MYYEEKSTANEEGWSRTTLHWMHVKFDLKTGTCEVVRWGNGPLPDPDNTDSYE